MALLSIEPLSKIHLFQGLQDYQLELISHLLMPLTVAQGEYILKEQTRGDKIYILFDGKVKVTKELVKGFDDQEAGEKMLATLSSEYYPTFGENGILDNNTRSANVIAITPCELFTLSQKDFDDFAVDHPAIAYQIMKNVASIQSKRLIDTDDNLVKLATALFISVSR